MDVNGDGVVADCSSGSQVACEDNEYGHLYFYGAGTTLGSGITPASQSPFSNIQSFRYWSSTEFDANNAWYFGFDDSTQNFGGKNTLARYAWAVRSGDVSAVPVPAALWLFCSGLLGLVGMVRRKNA